MQISAVMETFLLLNSLYGDVKLKFMEAPLKFPRAKNHATYSFPASQYLIARFYIKRNNNKCKAAIIKHFPPEKSGKRSNDVKAQAKN